MGRALRLGSAQEDRPFGSDGNRHGGIGTGLCCPRAEDGRCCLQHEAGRERLWVGATSSILTEGLTLADAFLAPLIMRFRTYGVTMPEDVQGYAQVLLMHPAVSDWIGRALRDPFVDRQYEG